MNNFIKNINPGVKGTHALLIISIVCTFISFCENNTINKNGWQQVPEIINRITAPQFQNKDYLITDFGAVADGNTDCTNAFRKAITACHEAGGGRVVVPEGRYLTRPIHLKSNINLHITENATILFSRDPAHYLPLVFSRWEGVECMNYSPLIYAYEQENIAITGKGTLDGQADDEHWWPWKGKEKNGYKPGQPHQNDARKKLFTMAENNVPVEERIMGEGAYLRPQFIQPYKCRHVLIDSITIKNSPMWEIHPVLCKNVIVQNVTIISHGPNNDGCNPESCEDVLIKNCYFDTGDDCIAIKSGRNADGRRINVSSQNIVIQNCKMKDGHGGVVIGSEISGGARNIFAENCQMDSPKLERALRIKTNAMRGGLVEHIYMRNITVGEVSDAILRVNMYYEEGDKGDFTPIVRDIYLQNVTSQKSTYALRLEGYQRSPVQDIHLEHCTLNNVAKSNILKHVAGLQMKNVSINGVLQK